MGRPTGAPAPWRRRDSGATTVRSICQAHGLKPHLATTFKVSTDPRFAEKPEDVAGLYLAAPEHALVLCCDEKSQRCRRWIARHPGFRARKAGRRPSHDYVRHGTMPLLAMLNIADGPVITTCQPKHRHQEWLKFLKLIVANTPAQRTLHLVLDNYAAHKHPKEKAWLARHPRFHLHFTPASAAWLNSSLSSNYTITASSASPSERATPERLAREPAHDEAA